MKFKIIQYKSGKLAGVPYPNSVKKDRIVVTKVFGDIDIPEAVLTAWEEYEKGHRKVSGPKHTGKEALRFMRSHFYSNSFSILRTDWEFNDDRVKKNLSKMGISSEVDFFPPEIN